MPFVCPYCQQKSLEITHAINVSPDAAYDEVQFQILTCQQCDMRTFGAYQESRRGRLDNEVIHHDGFQISDPGMDAVVKMITSCSTPYDHTCTCISHQKMSSGPDTWARMKENGIIIQRMFQLIYQE